MMLEDEAAGGHPPAPTQTSRGGLLLHEMLASTPDSTPESTPCASPRTLFASTPDSTPCATPRTSCCGGLSPATASTADSDEAFLMSQTAFAQTVFAWQPVPVFPGFVAVFPVPAEGEWHVDGQQRAPSQVRVIIYGLSGDSFDLSMDAASTVSHVKCAVNRQKHIPITEMMLICGSQVLGDDQTLQQVCDVRGADVEDLKIQLVRRLDLDPTKIWQEDRCSVFGIGDEEQESEDYHRFAARNVKVRVSTTEDNGQAPGLTLKQFDDPKRKKEYKKLSKDRFHEDDLEARTFIEDTMKAQYLRWTEANEGNGAQADELVVTVYPFNLGTSQRKSTKMFVLIKAKHQDAQARVRAFGDMYQEEIKRCGKAEMRLRQG